MMSRKLLKGLPETTCVYSQYSGFTYHNRYKHLGLYLHVKIKNPSRPASLHTMVYLCTSVGFFSLSQTSFVLVLAHYKNISFACRRSQEFPASLKGVSASSRKTFSLPNFLEMDGPKACMRKFIRRPADLYNKSHMTLPYPKSE